MRDKCSAGELDNIEEAQDNERSDCARWPAGVLSGFPRERPGKAKTGKPWGLSDRACPTESLQLPAAFLTAKFGRSREPLSGSHCDESFHDLLGTSRPPAIR